MKPELARRFNYSRLVFVLMQICMVSSLSAQNGPLEFDFKGVKLGSSERAFTSRHKDFGCTSDQNNKSVRVCSLRQTTFADLPVDRIEARFISDKFSYLTVRYPSTTDLVSDAMTSALVEGALESKYGKPHDGSNQWKHVDFAATRSSTWHGKQSRLMVFSLLTKSTGVISTSVTFQLDSYQEMLNRAGEKKLKSDI